MTTLVIAGFASDALARATLKAIVKRGHDVRLVALDAYEIARELPCHVEPWEPRELRSDARPALLLGCDTVITLERGMTSLPHEGRAFLHSSDVQALLGEAVAASTPRRLVRVTSAPRRVAGAYQASDITEIQPGDMYGPGDPIVWRLLVMMQTLRIVPVVNSTRWRVQPVWYEDIADAVARSVDLGEAAMFREIQLTGPSIVTQTELFQQFARLLDRQPTRMSIPAFVAKPAAAFTSAVEEHAPGVGARLPFARAPRPSRPEAARTLSRVFGIRPTPLTEGLAKLVSERR